MPPCNLQELCEGGSLRDLIMQQMNRYNKVGHSSALASAMVSCPRSQHRKLPQRVIVWSTATTAHSQRASKP